MKIAQLKIDNVLSIETAEVEVRDGVVLTGRTGAGKTAFLDALAAAFGRKNRVLMVRKGEQEGRVLLVMEDGTEVSRKIGPRGLGRAVVRDPSGKPIPSPQSYLDALAPALSFNPALFVSASGKERIRMLTEAFPVRVAKEEIERIAGKDLDLEGVRDELSLDDIGRIYQEAYRERTEVNGQLRHVRAQAEAEQRLVPDGFDPDAVRGISTKDLAEELARVETHNRRVRDTLSQKKRLEDQAASIEQQIAQLQERLNQARTRIQEAEQWLNENPEKPTQDLQKRIAELDEQRKSLAHHDRAQALVEESKKVEEKAKRLDACVKRLRELPGEVLAEADIPIDGLTVEEKDIHINGLPFTNLSDGQKMQVAVQVAKAGTGELKLVCVDGAEKLSEEARRKMIDDLARSGHQVFVTITSDGDLTIQPVATRRSEAEAARETDRAAERDLANLGEAANAEEEVDLDRYFSTPKESDEKIGLDEQTPIYLP